MLAQAAGYLSLDEISSILEVRFSAVVRNRPHSMNLSVFNASSAQASELLRLWNMCMWICDFVLAGGTASITFIRIRYRPRGPAEPKQITGNLKLEIAWTVIPIILVAVLCAMSIRTARAVDRPAPREPDIIVTGHQWWRDISYPSESATTANEIHILAGRDMLMAIQSADVIRDFRAPRLGRKIDATPLDSRGSARGIFREEILRSSTRVDVVPLLGAGHGYLQGVAEPRSSGEVKVVVAFLGTRHMADSAG
jgi:heme/copper-type cytochrome/quinol oxidase subunit 2